MRILFFATALTLLSAPSISGPAQPATIPSGTELIISHANYDAGVYLLKFTKYADGSVKLEPLNAQVVDLDGRTTSSPTDPGNDDEDPDDSLIDEVRANFDDELLFKKQLTLMRVALDVPDNMSLATVNAFIQGKMAISIGDHAEEWKPWTDWFIAEAVKQTSIDDYRAWVALAKDTLTE